MDILSKAPHKKFARALMKPVALHCFLLEPIRQFQSTRGHRRRLGMAVLGENGREVKIHLPLRKAMTI